MLAFDSEGDMEVTDPNYYDTPQATWAYNNAIEEVMRAHDLRPFHQIGEHNEPGFHGWEVWVQVTQEQMEALLPEVEAKVLEFVKMW